MSISTAVIQYQVKVFVSEEEEEQEESQSQSDVFITIFGTRGDSGCRHVVRQEDGEDRCKPGQVNRACFLL